MHHNYYNIPTVYICASSTCGYFQLGHYKQPPVDLPYNGMLRARMGDRSRTLFNFALDGTACTLALFSVIFFHRFVRSVRPACPLLRLSHADFSCLFARRWHIAVSKIFKWNYISWILQSISATKDSRLRETGTKSPSSSFMSKRSVISHFLCSFLLKPSSRILEVPNDVGSAMKH